MDFLSILRRIPNLLGLLIQLLYVSLSILIQFFQCLDFSPEILQLNFLLLNDILQIDDLRNRTVVSLVAFIMLY